MGRRLFSGPFPPSQAGFTLLEMLVALSIFALISVMAYRGLNLVLETREKVTAEGRKWQDITRLFSRLEQDFTMAVNRPVRDSRDLPMPALVGDPQPVGEDGALIAFTRMGLAGQRGALQDLQRFGYRLRGEAVEQLVWPVLDQAPRTRPAADELLTGVRALEARYLGRGGTWQDRWPLPGQPAELPAAVEVTLVLATGERMTRLFALP